jgi:hypothetical protein
MLRRLQPVSDLQRVQGFDDFDLAANRKGALSPRQRLRLIGGRLAEQALAILVVMFVFALAIDRLSLATSISLEQIGLVLATAVIVMAILLIFRLRRVFAPGVKAASGQISKYHAAPLDGFALEEITVGQTKFLLRPEVFDILDEDATYKLYYVERKLRAGGNVLLSMEVQGEAPAPEAVTPAKAGEQNPAPSAAETAKEEAKGDSKQVNIQA